MENNHDIDKKFNEASQSLEEPATFPGFDKVWAKVEEKLDKKRRQEENHSNLVSLWNCCKLNHWFGCILFH